MDTIRHQISRKISLLAILILFPFYSLPGITAETKLEYEPMDTKSSSFANIAVAALALRTISCDFLQEKHLSMLKNPLLSSGWFAYEKPDHLYWKFIRPSPAGFVVNGDKAKRWGNDPRLSQVFEIEKDPIAKAIIEQVFAWVRADFPWLEKRYKITVTEDTPTLLKLVPLSSQEKKYVSHLYIAFTEDWVHVKLVEIHEKGGDYTRITFSNISLNRPLPKDIFKQ